MTYFNLRKREPEAAPEKPEEEAQAAEETPEETVEETVEEQSAKEHGPLLTGLLGPGRWIAAHVGTGWAFGVHVVAVWAIGFYGGWTAVGVILAWLAAVLAFVPREFKDRISAALERLHTRRPEAAPQAEEKAPMSDPRAVHAATLQWVRGQIADRQGVHLRTLLAHAQEHGMFEDLDVTTLRAHLERHGFPIRNRVRVRGLGVTVGIHRDDLPPLSGPSPKSGGQDSPNSELHAT